MNEMNNNNGFGAAIASVLGALGFFEASRHGWERDYCNDVHRMHRSKSFLCLKIERVDQSLKVSLSMMGSVSMAVLSSAILFSIDGLEQFVETATRTTNHVPATEPEPVEAEPEKHVPFKGRKIYSATYSVQPLRVGVMAQRYVQSHRFITISHRAPRLTLRAEAGELKHGITSGHSIRGSQGRERNGFNNIPSKNR